MKGLEFGLEFLKEKALKGLDFCWALGAGTLLFMLVGIAGRFP